MLGTLKDFFKKKEEPTISDIYEPEPASNPNFLTDPNKINSLLKDIEQESPLCTISIEGITEEFSSSILDVQLDNKQIILDELFPKHGNKLLINKKIKLSTIHNGIRLALMLSDITDGSSRGIIYYKSAIPSRIYYPQRRTIPRIQLTVLNIPFSGVSSRTKSSVGGHIFDLSRGGIGIVIPNNRARIQRGDSIKNCRITLDDHSINFDLAIRFIKTTNQETGKTQIGGYFDNITSKGQNKLEHFVATLEREEIRKRKE